MAILKTKKADLNIHYKKYFQISMIIVLTMFIAAFKFSPDLTKNPPLKKDGGIVITVLDIPNSEQNLKPSIPPRPQIPEIATEDILDEPEFIDNDLNENDVVVALPDRDKTNNRSKSPKNHGSHRRDHTRCRSDCNEPG